MNLDFRHLACILLAGAMTACGPKDTTPTPGPDPGPDPDPDPMPKEEPAEPNVILILADDMGYGDISALNPQSKIDTPQINALCRSGVVFTDAHSASSLSTPSRYSILTGRYPWRTSQKNGVLNGYKSPLIASGRKTVANIFKTKGYNTACIGKWHLGWTWARNSSAEDDVNFTKDISNGPTSKGFDYFFGISASLDMPPYVYVENTMPTAVPNRTIPARTGLQLLREGPAAPDFTPEDCFPNMIRHTIDYIGRQKGSDKPFFLYLPLTAPHTPILPPAEFSGRSTIGAYGDFVIMIDDMVGKIVSALKTAGKYNNTIIIFASDNGCASYIKTKDMEQAGHYPSYIYRGYKTDLYEGGHRIPLIVSWGTKYSSTRISNSLVSLTDFYATFAQMLDYTAAPGEGEDSYSFWPALAGTGGATRSDVVCMSGDGYLAYRTPGMKLLFCSGSGGDSSSETSQQTPRQLYNMSTDPHEDTNLIGQGQYSTQVSTMTQTMKKYITDGRSTPGTAQSNDTGNSWSQVSVIMQ